MFCDKKYKSHAGLRNHVEAVHEGIIYKCNICQYIAKHKSHLTIHIRNVHFKELQLQYPCKICFYQATCTKDLSRHVDNVHLRSENVVCNQCHKSIQKQSLSRHMKMFHSGDQPQYNCKSCSFNTIHKGGLKRHNKNVHNKNRIQQD